MNAEALIWSPDAICLRPRSLHVESLAADHYARTCRTDFDAPGFCVLNTGDSVDSIACRQFMVDLKRAMAAIHESATGNTLIYLSAARFDQQIESQQHEFINTSIVRRRGYDKPHLDDDT